MKKVLFIMPPSHFVDQPHFQARFEALRDHLESEVLVSGDIAHDGQRFQGGRLHVHPLRSRHTPWHKLLHTLSLIRRGVAIARNKSVDVVVAYDPLMLGLVACCIKLLAGCKQVVEVNGHYKNAEAAILERGRDSPLKRFAFNLCCTIVFRFSDGIKLLNKQQYEEWKTILSRKKSFEFHDFVPVTRFSSSQTRGKTILCAGFPFAVKGVDILLEAFRILRQPHPDAHLIIMGHCREKERRHWSPLIESTPGAELLAPVHYEEMATVLQRCDIFAMPSRSEGMGRVFIEAMACGKPLVGTRVGGIPNVIHDGENGFLVEPESVEDLAEKLHTLLADVELREKMGKAGVALAHTIFSEERYAENMVAMLEAVTDPTNSATGILVNGYDISSSGSLARNIQDETVLPRQST